MATLSLGNNFTWSTYSKSRADVAAFLGDSASESSGAITLKKGVSFDNSKTDVEVRNRGSVYPAVKTETISSNTQGPYEINNNPAGFFGGGFVIASGVYVWSDSTASPALKVNVPTTITNNGYIIGKGGVGGYRANNAGAGGPALEIASGVSGVTVVNNSGGYIAGGGGGGAGSPNSGSDECGNGGGGAGGGRGGGQLSSRLGGAGGAIGASGSNGQTRVSSRDYGSGGGAGGGGGQGRNDGSGGGGGGRILPGTGGAGASGTSYANGGTGGSAGNIGANGGSWAGGGGGGWGARGGYSHGTYWIGGSGGAAIKDNGVTYTLTNNGTVYGTT